MIKLAEKLVQLRDRLYELQLALDHVRREVDSVANDMADKLEQQAIASEEPAD